MDQMDQMDLKNQPLPGNTGITSNQIPRFF